MSTYPFYAKTLKMGPEKDTRSKGSVIIGNDVWIGYGVVIFSGVKIGDGAIIAAGSYVINDIEPYTIYGGVPAKKIKDRFTEKQKSALLKIKWWDWDESLIIERVNDLYDDIDYFISKYDY